MKFLKRIQALTLAVVMTAMTFGTTTAFAAEKSDVESNIIDEISSGNEAVTRDSYLQTVVHQTFNMSYEHTGSTRSYSSYSYISFITLFRKQNGSALTDGTILAVRLFDATTGQKVNEWQSSSGNIVSGPIAINKSHRYYFQYCVAYGTPNLQIEMLIQGQP